MSPDNKLIIDELYKKTNKQSNKIIRLEIYIQQLKDQIEYQLDYIRQLETLINK